MRGQRECLDQEFEGVLARGTIDAPLQVAYRTSTELGAGCQRLLGEARSLAIPFEKCREVCRFSHRAAPEIFSLSLLSHHSTFRIQRGKLWVNMCLFCMVEVMAIGY